MNNTNTTVTNWLFPPPARNFTNFSFDANFNTSITNFITASINEQPGTGFASKAVYSGDKIGFSWVDGWERVIQHWCLGCLDSYSGKSGWNACSNFATSDRTRLINVTTIKSTDSTLWTLPKLKSQDSTPISAAVCLFVLPRLENEDSYDFTVTYPFINTNRLSSVEENKEKPMTFDKTVPAGTTGADDPKPPKTAARGSPTSTSITYPKAPESYHGKENGWPPVGTIVGSILGFLFGIGILFCLMKRYSKYSRARSQAFKNRAKYRATVAAGRLGTRSRPFVQDRLSRAESGEGRRPTRTDTEEAPPPAYHEVVTETGRASAERQIEEQERETENVNAARQSEEREAVEHTKREAKNSRRAGTW
ncbi:hypothetical protein K469DRAFT_746237 [Zopfia rhizophila CBS 207.26]|uniref:Uncharacterized protein n=1 Tax=Zopfia rhizophila CBS 207.26 TaxID=1314779 RepID=A0A6A6ELI8_9PEZI|nr:hypothetical protein K469DRAFT_746237 [Zopfia rhizophila CBS 207.26]